MNRTTITLFLFFISCLLTHQTFSQSVIDFDGINDNITVPNASSFIANSQLSMSAWVYPTNPSPGWPDFDGILGFRNDVNADFYLLHLNASSIEARFRNSAGTNYDMVYSGVTLNAWNHFVLTYDNSTLRLYHNGTSVMTLPASGSITSTTQALNIGFIPFQSNPFYFDGQLDDVALWNTSLSASQVASLYSNCGIDTAASNLVLAYEFNQGTAGGNNTGITNIVDSKNNAAGVISGFALTGISSNFVTDTKPLSTSFFTLTEFSCEPYTSPSGNYIWTSSGIYADTIFASAGCDSIYTVDLTLATTTTAFISVDDCDSYTSPGGNTWTTSGIYADTIQNVNGCDSIISIDLTILTPTTASLTINECDFYNSPGGNIYTTSGMYTDVIPNAAGCDSTITIDLIINNNSNAFFQALACESYTSPSGDFVWTSSGIYEDTLQNAAGCDSILLIDLTIGTPSVTNISAAACDAYLSPSGTYEWTVSGMYADTLTNMAGCDSILNIDLTIASFDTTTTRLSNTELLANMSGVVYQWIDCSSGLAIPGETNQLFNASSSGSYAVMISDNGCTDTSACVDIVLTGIADMQHTISFKLLPNPANEVVNLSVNEVISSFEISIFNTLGQQVEKRRFVNRQSTELTVSHLEAGIYIIQVIADEKIGSMKFLKR